nr:tetratricopeptide repeat protein [Candidatus Levybacteria bacterium]
MGEEQKLEIINYIERASIVLLGLLFILFPIFFTNLTTDFFTLPKQALLVFVTLSLMLLFGAKTVLTEKVIIRRTPFDLPVLLFLLAILLSTIFSVSRVDSFVNFVPFLFIGFSFFAITYNVKDEKSTIVLISSLLTGGALLSLITVFSYFKIYVFPFDFTKVQGFTPSGSLFDTALYLLFLLPLGLYFLTPFILRRKHRESLEDKKADITKMFGFGIVSIIILIGLILSLYSLLKPGMLPLLPMETGFQTAFAAISQDNGRIFQGLLFGSGYGQYLTDFTRFKQASFNANPLLWNFTFIKSSSFVLELLATTGLLGLLSFLFLCFKVIKERPLFIPLVIVLAMGFILPLSFFALVPLFFLLGIYAGLRGLKDDQKYFDVELALVALKKGFFAFALEDPTKAKRGNKTLSYFVLGLTIVTALFFGYGSFDYLSANIAFQKSLVAANQNNGQLTYDYQNQALASLTGKYIDSYHRVFSQTNLALANSLASSIPQGASPSAETSRTIYTLVQQSINAGRQATTLAPLNPINWQNLASIYRSLIGFGQNADSFAVLAQQQALKLDPANPQQYIALGGIYYQLRLWDKAQEQFQQAVNLKPDFPNGYYNLGHALQEKGDLKGALTQYQTVRTLVLNDKTNLDKIDTEIKAIEAALGQQASQTQNPTPKEALGIPTPSAVLPKQNPPVKIPGLSGTPTPTPTGTVSPTPSIAPSINP